MIPFLWKEGLAGKDRGRHREQPMPPYRTDNERSQSQSGASFAPKMFVGASGCPSGPKIHDWPPAERQRSTDTGGEREGVQS
jgi:hypothetical protein